VVYSNLKRTHSTCSSYQQTPDGKTMHRSVCPSRGRIHTVSREGPSSDSVAAGVHSTQTKSVKCPYVGQRYVHLLIQRLQRNLTLQNVTQLAPRSGTVEARPRTYLIRISFATQLEHL